MEHNRNKVGSASKADVLWIVGVLCVAVYGYARYFNVANLFKH